MRAVGLARSAGPRQMGGQRPGGLVRRVAGRRWPPPGGWCRPALPAQPRRGKLGPLAVHPDRRRSARRRARAASSSRPSPRRAVRLQRPGHGLADWWWRICHPVKAADTGLLPVRTAGPARGSAACGPPSAAAPQTLPTCCSTVRAGRGAVLAPQAAHRRGQLGFQYLDAAPLRGDAVSDRCQLRGRKCARRRKCAGCQGGFTDSGQVLQPFGYPAELSNEFLDQAGNHARCTVLIIGHRLRSFREAIIRSCRHVIIPGPRRVRLTTAGQTPHLASLHVNEGAVVGEYYAAAGLESAKVGGGCGLLVQGCIS